MSDSTEQQLQELAKLYREDHDVTIRVDTKLDGLITENRQNHSTVMKTLSDHETRLSSLERKDEVDRGIKMEKAATRKDFAEKIVLMATVVTAFATWALTGFKGVR